MAKAPYFSIIIPCLNEEKRLPFLLKDLNAQSFQDFEVIIVDGQSTDQTVSKAKEYQTLFPSLTILSSKIKNVSVQRNMGAKVAKGELLLFNDADNRLPISFLNQLHNQTTHFHPDIFSVYMQTKTSNLVAAFSLFAINFYTRLQQNSPSPYVVEALFGFKKEVFHKLNGFRADLPISEGTDILKRSKKLGFIFKVFTKPKYTFSLRRLEKEGLLKMSLNIFKIELLRFLGRPLTPKEAAKIYPMNGGNYYDKTKI